MGELIWLTIVPITAAGLFWLGCASLVGLIRLAHRCSQRNADYRNAVWDAMHAAEEQRRRRHRYLIRLSEGLTYEDPPWASGT